MDLPMPAAPLTAEVLAALRGIGCPAITTDLMRLLNRGRDRPLIVDQVYRAANAFRIRGQVRRLRAEANKRVRCWEYVEAQSACTCCQSSGLALAVGGDPTTVITGPLDALVTAEGLLNRVLRPTSGQEFWASVAAAPLAGLLLAASPQGNGGGIRWVRHAFDGGDAAIEASWRQAARICHRLGGADSQSAALLAERLLRVAALSSRQRGSLCETMRAAITAGSHR